MKIIQAACSSVCHILTTPDKSFIRKEEKMTFIVTHHPIKLDFPLLYPPHMTLFQMHLNE